MIATEVTDLFPDSLPPAKPAPPAGASTAPVSVRTGVFSPCRLYRYTLTRVWDAARPLCNFVGLNPSTATETLDDPTIRRCMGFARRDGAGGLIMTNLFAFRATNPKDMIAEEEPVGHDNNEHILAAAKASFYTVLACGAHGAHRGRLAAVAVMLRSNGVELLCLGTTESGMPLHPLYLKSETEFRIFEFIQEVRKK